MKNIGKFIIKALVVIVLFTGTSIGLSSVGVKSVSEAKAAVSYQQVYAYLVSRGYTVVSLKPYGNSANWMSHTIFDGIHYQTTVLVEGNQIIGVLDSPM